MPEIKLNEQEQARLTEIRQLKIARQSIMREAKKTGNKRLRSLANVLKYSK